MSLRAALAVKRGLPRPDAVCSALQMQEMANCGAVVSPGPAGTALYRLVLMQPCNCCCCMTQQCKLEPVRAKRNRTIMQ
jgi:hypothetical protein